MSRTYRSFTHLNLQLRKLSFKIVHSTTITLPAWYDILEEMESLKKTIPRDVATRWNSTYDMLKVALEYQKAVDRLTGEKENGLRQFELSKTEWKLVTQLRDVLKVNRIDFKLRFA